ncbi:hypothetical protein ABGT18_07820 [Pseudomonas putida]|jgi:hypothetical protein|uniref:hypothetical protein n=1 Tax=Pseudomonas TaxID=286 RepID=UPI001CB904AA|nr:MULTISPECIES: hypothetical protein [Pseudomonas]MCG3646316.1 hypothetical protein [Pseudomonas putida]MDH1928658.1 hypothetical protein [Pseudomonas sp. GD03696]MDX3740439.1 hypothetical protein [Pseudomonas sp.]
MDEQQEWPMYNGRPTVYFDQNVIDLAVKQRDPAFFTQFSKDFQIVYSDHTLREIKRSGQPDKFLEVLSRFNAMILKHDVDSAFQPTGQMFLASTPPVAAFEQYVATAPFFDQMLASAHQTTLKMFGGRKDNSFEDIAAEQTEAFKGLMKMVADGAAALADTHPELVAAADQYIEITQRAYEKATQLSAQEMTKHIDESGAKSGIQGYREAVGAGPVQLNNIEAPNVIKKIWARYQNLDGYKDRGFTIENFLGISASPIHGRELYRFEKVTSIYNVLNVIGYNPDSRLDKENRHIASISDAAHASTAIFTNVLLSGDAAFVSKVRAIYEYLDIRTEVGLVTVQGERVLITT